MGSPGSGGDWDFSGSNPKSASWAWGTWHISALLLNSSSAMAGGTKRLRMI